MLHNLLHQFNFKRSVKSGIYVDFLVKRLSLHLLKNQFNWSSIFILEKFVIEYLSRYIFSSLSIYNTKSPQHNAFNYFFIIYVLLVMALL